MRRALRIFIGVIIAVNVVIAVWQGINMIDMHRQSARNEAPPAGSADRQAAAPESSASLEAPPSGGGLPSREADTEAMGRYLYARAQDPVGRLDIDTVPGQQICPDLHRVFQVYESPERDPKTLHDEEAELIYDYLLGTPERAAQSFAKLSRSLCWEKMDTVWFECRRSADGRTVPEDGVCPVGHTAYTADADGLHCPYHQSILTFPDRTPRPNPDEIYPQLSMGYFNSQRTHLLDKAILGDGISAVRPGETVLDCGSGVGCYTWAMYRGLKGRGKVIASDVDDTVLDFVSFVARKRGADNVVALRCTREDPHLEPKSVDRIYIIDVLNTMMGMSEMNGTDIKPENKSYMPKLTAALRDNGRLVIIDFPPEGDRPHIPADAAIKIMARFGMKVIGNELLQLDNGQMYVLTFAKAE